MLLKFIKQISLVRRLYRSRLGRWWVRRKLKTVLPHLPRGKKNLDLGCGNGLVTAHLRKLDFEVQPVDVADLSILDEVKPLVYDGDRLPFADAEFDTGLLLTVLHHTESPETVLREAARVCKQLIIIEDVYSNVLQKYLTFGMDTLINLGHSAMTYQNKSRAEWKTTFEALGLTLKHIQSKRVLLFFRQDTYLVLKA